MAMDPHHALLQRLPRHPTLKYKEKLGWLRIEAPLPNGFAVELHSGEAEWTVYLGEGGFHETFASADEVSNFIAWCFSGEARLREIWRGTLPQKVMLETLVDGDWCEVSMTGYLLVPFWLSRREVILTNPCLLLSN
jgi:hypothetical protein